MRLHALPRAALVQQLAGRVPEDPRVQALIYLQRCTGENDRIIALPPWVGLYYFADRRFAGGQPNWSPGFFSAASDQQRWIETVQRQGVELVFGDFSRILDGRDERRFETYSPLVTEYVATAVRPDRPLRPAAAARPAARGTVTAAVDGVPPCLPPRVGGGTVSRRAAARGSLHGVEARLRPAALGIRGGVGRSIGASVASSASAAAGRRAPRRD